MATLAQAKRDFQHGIIKSARIQLLMGEIVVELMYEGKVGADTLDEARTKTPRHFKSLYGAVKAVEDVGFSVKSLIVAG